MNDKPSAPTRAIGRYTILRELRRERHSVSYAAVDPVMNRQLVVKAVELLPAGPRLSTDERRRVEQAFVRQAQAAGRLQHPHIVTVFDAGLSHAFGFLVIERINGRPLHELLAVGCARPTCNAPASRRALPMRSNAPTATASRMGTWGRSMFSCWPTARPRSPVSGVGSTMAPAATRPGPAPHGCCLISRMKSPRKRAAPTCARSGNCFS